MIQTFSAKDQDLPSAGQQFSFKSSREDNKNRNFTIRDFGSKDEFFLQLCVGSVLLQNLQRFSKCTIVNVLIYIDMRAVFDCKMRVRTVRV